MTHYCKICYSANTKPYTMLDGSTMHFCKECIPYVADLVKCCITCELLDGCRWHPDDNPHKFYCKDWSVRHE